MKKVRIDEIFGDELENEWVRLGRSRAEEFEFSSLELIGFINTIGLHRG